ncbi:hypothetical protein [Cobetia amphilecti]|uniref:hypothetical protein n=1 Tax=Cobetia amphilecti TaxID=1055104 RepID=UPI003F5FB1EB
MQAENLQAPKYWRGRLTRGGDQKTLKAWKKEYGAETVEYWLVKPMTKSFHCPQEGW